LLWASGLPASGAAHGDFTGWLLAFYGCLGTINPLQATAAVDSFHCIFREGETQMDFGYAFGYAFKDPDWFKKLAIMGLVTLIPVLGQFVLIGWMMALMRRVINRQEPALLPDLDFSAQLSDGFKAFVVGIVYQAPTLAVYLVITHK